jgi:hypothetical protein
MPLRFYGRFRAGPFRLNVSKRGLSASVGTRGGRAEAPWSHSQCRDFSPRLRFRRAARPGTPS